MKNQTIDTPQVSKFEGNKLLYDLYSAFEKPESLSKEVYMAKMTSAWSGVKSVDDLHLFLAIVFRTGSVPRQHMQHKRKYASQGMAVRKTIFWLAEWFEKNLKELAFSKEYMEEFVTFFSYTDLLADWNKTETYQGQLLEHVTTSFSEDMIIAKAKFVAKVMKRLSEDNPIHYILAKAIGNVVFSSSRRRDYILPEGKNHRQAHRTNLKGKFSTKKVAKKDFTIQRWNRKKLFLKTLSDEAGFDYVDHGTHIDFYGIRKYKKRYRSNSATTILSQKTYEQMNESDFIIAYDQFTAGDKSMMNKASFLGLSDDVSMKACEKANKVLKDGTVLGTAIARYWEKKEKKVEKFVGMTDEEKAEMSEEEYQELKTEAKLNTGAKNPLSFMFRILGKHFQYGLPILHEERLELEYLVKNLKMPDRGVGLALDVSGSMTMFKNLMSIGNVKINNKTIDGVFRVDPQLYSSVVLSLIMHRSGIPFFIAFDNSAYVYYDKVQFVKARDSFFSEDDKSIKLTSIIGKDVIETFQNVYNIAKSHRGMATHIDSIPVRLKSYVNEVDELKEQRHEFLSQFKIFLALSDGHFNNDARGAFQSVERYQKEMVTLGLSDFLFVWDCVPGSATDKFSKTKFKNYFHTSSTNPNVFESLLGQTSSLKITTPYMQLDALANSKEFQSLRRVAEKYFKKKKVKQMV